MKWEEIYYNNFSSNLDFTKVFQSLFYSITDNEDGYVMQP